ncbi:hypothetical protein ABZT43_12125 [Streptomyces sp. NPDC005349]|uniref:hypothetical protein n=1 Tax=Streptomyces sp. NPDC005349 TaxID=3157037 RepID=UPI0033BD3115
MPIPGNLLSSTTEMVDPNTSGWTTKLNCTLGLGTGGRNGDGCLSVRSVAAGEMQARTVSSYPVSAGILYQTFADTAGSVPERMGIRWLNASGAEVGLTWSLTTMAASSSWHRVGVAGIAPVGATQAQVVVSSTEAGATVSHYWENFYLGLPIRTTGNLFGFTTESAELDAAGWTPLVNATVSRQVPVVGWAVDNYTAGAHTIAMTATAAGNASMLATDRPPATPGVEYLAYAYLNPPTIAAASWIELRFYDVNANQIAAQRSSLAAPGTGMYRQRASMVAPAGAASCSVATGVDGASAGQILRLETVVVTVAPQLQSGSVLPYADSSFEQGVATWTKTSGVATLARTSPWGASSWEGGYSLAATSTTATVSVLRSGRFPTPGAAGTNWRAQVLAHAAGGSWTSLAVRLRWYDAANTDLGASTGNAYTLPGSSFYLMPTDGIAPAGATQAAIDLTLTAAATNSIVHIDQATLWQVLPQTAAEALDADGYVRLTLRELPLDFLISVYRTGADGRRTLVRGPAGLLDKEPITSDLMVIEDHEIPLGVPVRYFIEFYNSSGAVSSSRSTSDYVTISLADINECWIKDPGNPQRNMRVMVQQAPDWTRPVEQSAYIVRGRRNKVVLSGNRQGLEGDLALWTRSDEERKALHLLLDSGNTLLWQAAPGMGVDDMYVSAGAAAEARTGGLAQEPWRAWSLPLVETDMPVTTGVNGAAGRTWQDVIAEFTTCADLLPVYATCEALFLDRRSEP